MYAIGVDIGTTATKAVLINDKGDKKNSSYKGYKLLTPAADYVEQNPAEWWEAFVYTVRDCIRDIKDIDNIRAISVSSQGGSLVPVDSKGEPLSNAIIWMDTRAKVQQESVLKIYPNGFFYRKTGWPLTNCLNMLQIKWLYDNSREVYNKAYKFLSTIDYINFKMTGRFAIDPSNAVMTQLMDLSSMKWDADLLGLAGISEEKLPVIVKSGEIIGNLTQNAAEELGLGREVKVFSGGHDQYCGAVGAGTVNAGDFLLSTGAAWALLGIMNEPFFDYDTGIAPGHHIIDGLWGAIGTTPTGGAAMEWFRENFCRMKQVNDESTLESYREIDANAGSVMADSKDLFFYPYFYGSGYPSYNSGVRAGFMGLSLSHGRYNMALAIMEGIAFELGILLELFSRKEVAVKNLKVCGGAAKSGLWSEIIASVCDCPVTMMNEADIASIGAAIIAGMGCGVFSDYIDGIKKIRKSETLVCVNEEKKAFYRDKFKKYRNGVKAVEGFFK